MSNAPRIDYNVIASVPTVDAKVQAIELEIARIGGIGNACLTDVWLNNSFVGAHYAAAASAFTFDADHPVD